MKTIKILILLLIGVAIQVLLTQCFTATDIRHEYIVTDFEMINYAFSNSEDIYIKHELKNDSIDGKSNYGFRIDFKTSIEKTVDLKAYNLSLIKSCYAFKKSTEVYRLMNKMDSISIFTKNDFDSLHLMNSNITDLFNILISSTIDSTEALRTGFINYYSEYQDYDSDETVDPITIFLRKRAELDSNLQFEINLHLEDNTVITRNTSLVKQY